MFTYYGKKEMCIDDMYEKNCNCIKKFDKLDRLLYEARYSET